MPQPNLNTIPATACLFGGEVEFGDNGENAKTVPIRMLARSGQPIEHWYWGRVVHDMAGMQLNKKRIPLDYVHGEEIGYLNKFEATNDGLAVSGAIVPTSEPSDPAPKVIARQRGGVPYEASINFGGDGIKCEVIGEGQVTEVNGYQFEGPGIVIRQWPLRGVAVCPYGADMNTESKFSQAETFSAQPFEREIVMSEATPPVETAATPAVVEAPAVLNNAEAAELSTKPEAVEAKPATELTDTRAEAKRYREAFGDQGAIWFAEGLAFEACYAKALANRDAEIAELKQKLSAPKPEGEAEPVKFQATDAKKATGLEGKIRIVGAK
jgi:hypothetical protein